MVVTLYVFLVVLLFISIYLIHREWTFRKLNSSVHIDIAKGFFHRLDYEMNSLGSISKYTDLKNNEIEEIQIPSLYIEINDSDSREDIQRYLSDFFAKENIQKGVGHLSLSKIPYFKNVKPQTSVRLIAELIIKRIPSSESLVKMSLLKSEGVNNLHNKIYVFWTELVSKVDSSDKRLKERFRELCEECYALLISADQVFETLNPENQKRSFKVGLKAKLSTFKLENADLLDIGAMTMLTYFVLDLDDLDIIDIGLDEVISETLLDSAGDALDTSSTIGIPIYSLVKETRKQIRLGNQNLTTFGESALNASVTVGTKAVGAFAAGKAGAVLGSIILPGIGTVVGGVLGGIAGAFAGLFVSKKWKKERYVSAAEEYNAGRSNFLQWLRTGLADIYNNISKKITNWQGNLEDNLVNLKVTSPSRPVTNYLKDHTRRVILNEIDSIQSLQEKFSKYKRKKARNIIEKLQSAIESYQVFVELISSDRPSGAKRINIEIFKDTPILKGGEIEKILIAEKEALVDLNTKFSLGMIIWNFQIVHAYDNIIQNIVDEHNSMQEGLNSKAEIRNLQLLEKKRKADMLKAQIKG